MYQQCGWTGDHGVNVMLNVDTVRVSDTENVMVMTAKATVWKTRSVIWDPAMEVSMNQQD